MHGTSHQTGTVSQRFKTLVNVNVNLCCMIVNITLDGVCICFTFF